MVKKELEQPLGLPKQLKAAPESELVLPAKRVIKMKLLGMKAMER